MTNLLSVLPDFDIQPYTHLLPSLEKALISTADLLTLDALHVAKRAQLPPGEVKKLADGLLGALHASLNVQDDLEGAITKRDFHLPQHALISTLDRQLDASLNGGIPRGHLTEIVGESAAGKTQFLLTLLLSVQLLPDPHKRNALYISTEAPLQTTRLTQILRSHPTLSSLQDSEKPSLARIQSTHIHDLEAQDHILRYQVPVAIKKQNIGLLVIDSIAANYRAEFDKSKIRKGAESFAKRSAQVAQTGALLREIARTHDIAVVVANQVADRFTLESTGQGGGAFTSQSTQRSRPASPPHSLPTAQRSGQQQQQQYSQPAPSSNTQPTSTLSTDDPLSLDHQQRFFTGWGDDPSVTNSKTPSLGLTWTNQLAGRIALLKEPVYDDSKPPVLGEERTVVGWKRTARVVFGSWCAEGEETFEIWEGGIRGKGGGEGDGG